MIDTILDAFRVQLDSDFDAYRNHCQRVFHLALALRGPVDKTEALKLAIAVAFHDLGIWTSGTLDYLAPSRMLARAYLAANGHEDWTDEIEDMIEQHHALLSASDDIGGLTETFRKADMVDVSWGLRRFGLPRGLMDDLHRRFPNAGFHLFLLKAFARRALTHPLNLMPMMKWRVGPI